MLIKTIRTTVATLTFAAFAAAAIPAFADEAKMPQTAADHEALAKSYKDQAAQFRKVAEDHKQMAEAYAKAHPDAKSGSKNPWNTKMQKHCQALSKDAEKVAGDADKAAEFHTLRAKELQGK